MQVTIVRDKASWEDFNRMCRRLIEAIEINFVCDEVSSEDIAILRIYAEK